MHIGQAAQGAALRIGKPTLPALIYKMYLAHGVFTLGSCPCNRICIAGIKNGGLCNKSEVGRRTLKHAANRLSVGCGNRCIFNSIRAAYIRISRSATYLVCALGFHISACRQLIGQLLLSSIGHSVAGYLTVLQQKLACVKPCTVDMRTVQHNRKIGAAVRVFAARLPHFNAVIVPADKQIRSHGGQVA